MPARVIIARADESRARAVAHEATRAREDLAGRPRAVRARLETAPRDTLTEWIWRWRGARGGGGGGGG